MMASANIRGLEPATTKIASIPTVVQRRCREGLVQSATYVWRRAYANCPTGMWPEDQHPGDLRECVSYVVYKAHAVVGLVKRQFNRGGRNSAHQWPFLYGVWVEFGRHGQPARPFMRPAAEVGRVEFPSQIAAKGRDIERDLAE